MRLADKIDAMITIRELFPKCHYCGEEIRHVPLAHLAKVDGRNRLAHLSCPVVSDAQ
ncbi:MAG TPA: hypothetical protein VN613_05995 [Gemmatimonadaceae bacterium]|nr:hypothetical protein [Gemmatimonadaceae bacterium]